MTKLKKDETELEFRNDFNRGDLYQKWHEIYDSDDYLSRWARHRMEVVLKRIDSYDLGRNGRALDIGVGSGFLFKELSKRGCNTWGSDFAFNMAQNCHKRYGNRFMVADIETLPVRDDSFDLVTCLGVLEYLTHEEKAIGELYRIIRPGGYLVLAVASCIRLEYFVSYMKRKFIGKKREHLDPLRGVLSLYDYVRLYSPLKIKWKMVSAGFGVEKFECFGGRLFGKYIPMRIFVPKVIYVGDHCLLVLRKPTGARNS